MSITTYAELQTAINSWLARTDLATNVPDFIANFEAAANRRLRVRQMETSTTLTPSSGSVSLPADYLSWRRVTWSGSPLQQLEYVTPDYMNWAFTTTSVANPAVFTIEGSTLKVRPSSNTALDFDYFQKIPALVTSSTNWLLTAHPDCYLKGALYEAYDFIMDKESAFMRKTQRDEVFDEIATLSNKTRGVGGMRVLGPTP
jgi:hypothetical protein